MKFRLLIVALGTILLTGLAAAQTPTPSHIRGSIASLDGKTLGITTRDGKTLAVSLMENTRFIAFKRTDLAAIAPGAFIGTAARPGADGQLVAVEVVVFNAAARGSGEGHFDWDLAPDTSMTNATVDAAVDSAAGRELTLSYKGGSVKVVVPPDVPVVTPIGASRTDLAVGKAVFMLGLLNPDGTYRTPFVALEKDGVAPPM